MLSRVKIGYLFPDQNSFCLLLFTNELDNTKRAIQNIEVELKDMRRTILDEVWYGARHEMFSAAKERQEGGYDLEFALQPIVLFSGRGGLLVIAMQATLFRRHHQ